MLQLGRSMHTQLMFGSLLCDIQVNAKLARIHVSVHRVFGVHSNFSVPGGIYLPAENGIRSAGQEISDITRAVCCLSDNDIPSIIFHVLQYAFCCTELGRHREARPS